MKEKGFYWVRITNEWSVAWWDGTWFFTTSPEHPHNNQFYPNELTEIGDKIEPPIPKHLHEFFNVASQSGKRFKYCYCGQILVSDSLFSHKELTRIRQDLNTPGAALRVAEDENE
jgi:hypothetical protein